MTKNELESIDVLTLLPQRPPFVMIDCLTHFDDVLTASRFQVKADNIFMGDDGVLNSCALAENIAQTCAARMGYINQYILKDKVKLGFIGDIKHLKIWREARVGDELRTEIEVMQEVLQMTLVKATVKVGEETIVTADMKIALTDIDAAD
jgi:3-hydroxymyristoyl/3-hydroxydecanoyl-(acyl carrier protein) dehydratase